MKAAKIDWPGFVASIGLILLACVPLLLFPESGGEFLGRVYSLMTTHFGFLYLLSGFAVLAFLLWLALGPYGRVRLAVKDEKPEFSTLSWTVMLFCAPIEWGYYYGAPPFGVEPNSGSAAEWASTYGIFHWGPTAWAFPPR